VTFKPEQIKSLQAPLSTANVLEREQGGKRLSYIEAWHAIAEANRIFGFDAWTSETVMLTETNRELVELKGQNGPYKQWRVGYLAKVRITVAGVTREGTGFGSGMGKPEALGDAIESAAKEAESDARKRALMTFGNPFGLALYDKSRSMVTTDAPPPRSGQRKTAAQAKRDGDHEKYTKEIDNLDKGGVLDWLEHFDEYTADAPLSWLDPLRDRLELRREELMNPHVDAEAELDAGFRGAVGPSEVGMARNGRHAEAPV
jgi:DNA recombination protein Rad52